MNDSTSENHSILIADIGGTNARFALTTERSPFYRFTKTLQCADFATFDEAIDNYLSTQGIRQLNGICMAVAGTIINESVEFTNNHWKIDSAALRELHKTTKVQLLNDFEAIAYSLAKLDMLEQNNDLLAIGGKWQFAHQQDFTVAVAGPGSGLGVGGLIKRQGNLVPLITEGGHAGFAPQTPEQLAILEYIQKKHNDRVSNERLVSGPGLVNIYEALCHIRQEENPGLSAADIAESAVNKSNNLCVQSFDLFFEVLGQLAGDIVLGTGAFDGFFVGGGIAQRYPEALAQSRFRQGFENKGRFRSILEKTPTWLITHPNPGLLGASVYAQTRL